MTDLKPSTLVMRFGKSRAVIGVVDFREASEKWCAYRDAGGLGASESPRVTVIDTATGKTVAHISYNGGIWNGAMSMKANSRMQRA